MNIIIAGCGKVGFTLAEQLLEEGHEITIIDTKQENLLAVSSILDVQVLHGNCTLYSILKEAGIEKADLLIAVTNSDEINLLSCLIARKAGKCKTIARVRNPQYNEDIQFIKKELELSLTINPEWASAVEIAQLIQVPSAMEVDSFARNKVNMIRFIVPENSKLHNIKISDIPPNYGKNVLICVIERNHKVIIPSGSDIIKQGDSISMILPLTQVNNFFAKAGINTKPIKTVMIAGGGTISYYLTKLLVHMNFSVKIIEINRKRCEELSEIFPNVIIINGDATDKELLIEEGIEKTDAFVGLTGFDEENLLLSLYAHKVSKAKNIIKINRISFDEVIEEMNVGSIVYPKYITTEFIIQYVRAMQNSLGSSVETLYRLMDNKVEALEFKVTENSGLTNIQIQDLNLKKNIIICCISRNNRIITPTGKDMLLVGDTVIIVTTCIGLNNLKDILV